jgi:hypothetical protein
VRRLLREPIVHFFALAALLFVAYRIVSPRGAAPDAIVVSADRIAALAAQFERTWMRPPSEPELDALIEGHVLEEILYREGIALGLDRDDPVIRNRVRQKMELLGEDTAAAEPTDADLQAWLDTHPADFAIPERFAFEQIYFDPARHGAALAEVVSSARSRLETGADATQLGDATLLPASLGPAPSSEVERTFGPELAQALPALEPGAWRGPVRSSYGVHLVRVTARDAGRVPGLGEVRDVVAREWASARSREAARAFHRALRERYRVSIERPGTAAAPPPVAAR